MQETVCWLKGVLLEECVVLQLTLAVTSLLSELIWSREAAWTGTCG